MARRNIQHRINAGNIKTNFSDFPATVAGFTREDVFVDDLTTETTFNYVSYIRGRDLGYVTAEDLAAGRLQVRKIAQVKPEGGGRKVAVPSERVY